MKALIHHNGFHVLRGAGSVVNNAVVGFSFSFKPVYILAVLYKLADKLNAQPFIKFRVVAQLQAAQWQCLAKHADTDKYKAP